MALNIVCFGEVLWDEFPDKKIIGGAPLNVALRLGSLGNSVSMISRVGADQEGRDLTAYLHENQLLIEGVQIDPKLPTGKVKVHLDKSNTATYTILAPVAWDNIELSPHDLSNVGSSDAFVYGSLACRNMTSKNTLLKLIERVKFKVFDANLRPPYYDLDLVNQLMQQADLIKLNDEELDEIVSYLDIPSKDIEESMQLIALKTKAKYICVTLGSKGALLLADKKLYSNTGYIVQVIDTVGAGDSFLAYLIHQLLSGSGPQESLDRSCAMGALVASKKGAIAEVKTSEIDQLAKDH